MFLLYMQEGPYRKMTEIDEDQRSVHGDLTRKFLRTPDTGAGGETKIRVRQVRRRTRAWSLVPMQTC